MVLRAVPKPLYVQIADKIRGDIRSGKYPPGSLIPSESAISKKYGVGRITTRHALNLLSDEKLIVKKQGLGTFVSSMPIHQELSDLKTITEVLLSKGVKPKIKVISHDIVSPAEFVRFGLNLIEEKVYQIKRLYLVESNPFCLVTIYLPTKYEHVAKPLRKSVPATETTYTLFERAGILPAEARHVIKAVEADKDAAECLNVEVGRPLLCMERITYTSSGAPFEFLVFQYRADSSGFIIKVPRAKESSKTDEDQLVDGFLDVFNPQI